MRPHEGDVQGDVQGVPQRPRRSPPASAQGRVSGSAARRRRDEPDPEWDGDDEDVYVIDTRRRRPRPPAAGDRGGAATPPGRTSGSSRPASASRPPRRRHRVRTTLVLLLVVVVAWAAYLVYTPWHAWSTVARVESTPDGARPAAGGGHNYLLVGSDSRAGLTAAQRKQLHTGKDPGKRTDSIILVHTPSGGGKPVLVSIPRDSYVPIPGHGSNKINASYAIGGPTLLTATVEGATGLRVDGYVEIGFGGFAALVDSLGGVDICVPFHMNDPKAHINLKKGCQTLSGPNALGYVRARYSDPRGDIGRAQRQRQFLGALMKKAATPSTVLNPVRYWDVTHNGVKGIGVGDGTSFMDAGRVVLTMRKVSSGEALSLVVPIQTESLQTGAGIAVKWDTARAQQLFTTLRNDDPLEAPPAGTDGRPTGT